MSFLHSNSGGKMRSGLGLPVRSGAVYPAFVTQILSFAVLTGMAFAQTPRDLKASATLLTAREISEYLVERNAPAFNSSAKSSPDVSVNVIVQKLMKASERRAAQLGGFQGKRWYHLQYHGFLGGRDANMEVLATYSAPDARSFSVLSESGSKLLLNRILVKLLESEQRAFRNQKSFQLSPANYKFDLLGAERQPDGSLCYVLAVKAREPNEFLYNGKIWVDADDFAVRRMEGEPSKSPSFWIKDTQIQSRWEKIGNFWFIAHNQSVSHVRMGGVATLTIDYGYLQVTAADKRATRIQAQGSILPDPASITPER